MDTQQKLANDAKLIEILTLSTKNRESNGEYSPKTQEDCVNQLLTLLPFMPEQAELIMTAAVNISDELSQRGYFKNAFRTSDDIFEKGNLKATRTLMNCAMDAANYLTAFECMKRLREKDPSVRDDLAASIEDCRARPNPGKLDAAASTAHIFARDFNDFVHLETIADIAEKQSQPTLALEVYSNFDELSWSKNIKFTFDPKVKAADLFLNPTETCNIYDTSSLERAVCLFARISSPWDHFSEINGITHQVSCALKERGHKALALTVTTMSLSLKNNVACDQKHRGVILEHDITKLANNAAALASEFLPEIQSEMEQQGYLSLQSLKICTEIARTCGITMNLQQNGLGKAFDLKGLDSDPYMALDMLYDSRPEGKLDTLKVVAATGLYPKEDLYARRLDAICLYLNVRTPENEPTDTKCPLIKEALTRYADWSYQEAATENALRDFNRATKPLLPQGYRSLGAGIRQRTERPVLRLPRYQP